MTNNQNDNENLNYKLLCVLEEFEVLRDEIITFGDRQLKLFEIIILTLTIFYLFIAYSRIFDAMILIPFFISPFIFRYAWDQRNVTIIGRYIRDEIEAIKIPKLIGYLTSKETNSKKLWIGWQHYWDKFGYEPMIKLGWYYKHFALIMLLLCSIIPSIGYSILILIQYFEQINPVYIHSIFPPIIHLELIIVYIWLILIMLKELTFTKKENVIPKGN